MKKLILSVLLVIFVTGCGVGTVKEEPKKEITWDGVYDSTGKMFSFAKALSYAVKNSPYSELSEDIVAASGFAFRMWLAEDLCTSETSIWDFGLQKPGIENGGINVVAINYFWNEDSINAMRPTALSKIKESINNGIPVIAWDTGILEWGLIIGYDDNKELLTTLAVDNEIYELEYEKLGNRDMPIMNIIILSGINEEKTQDKISRGMIQTAIEHLKGNEWGEGNAQGLAVYPALIKMFESEDSELAECENMKYALGNYAPLKYYAWKYFEKYDMPDLSLLYKQVFNYWADSYEILTTDDMSDAANRQKIADLLAEAEKCEIEAVAIMEKAISEN